MNLVQMRSFHAVALTGSFLAASRMLHVSQPTITTQVKALERSYGVQLFGRHGRGVRLTETGRVLFDLTKKVMADWNDSVEYLKQSKDLRVGHLRVAAVGSQQVIGVLNEFHKRYPQVQLTLRFGNSKEIEASILDYTADIGFLAEISALQRFHRVRYSHPEILVVVHPNHAWRSRKTIRIQELEGQPIITRETGSETRRVVENAVKKNKVILSPVMEIHSREGVLAAVSRGMGVGFVSEEELGPYRVHPVRVSSSQMHTYVDIACLQERNEARLQRAFFEVAESVKAAT